MKQNKNEETKSEFSTLLKKTLLDINLLHECVVLLVMQCGGFVKTQKKGCDIIYSTEYVDVENAELTERTVLAVRVKDGELQILSHAYTPGIKMVVSDSDLNNPELENEWEPVKNGYSVLYIPTIMNIAECISQYI